MNDRRSQTADPEIPVRHRHGRTVHIHGGSRGFVIGRVHVPDAYPQWDEHQHLTLDARTGATLAETAPSRPLNVCDHCEEALVETFRIMHGPFGPHELGLCHPCGESFDEMIRSENPA
jgi:hypothetical protein